MQMMGYGKKKTVVPCPLVAQKKQPDCNLSNDTLKIMCTHFSIKLVFFPFDVCDILKEGKVSLLRKLIAYYCHSP